MLYNRYRLFSYNPNILPQVSASLELGISTEKVMGFLSGPLIIPKMDIFLNLFLQCSLATHSVAFLNVLNV